MTRVFSPRSQGNATLTALTSKPWTWLFRPSRTPLPPTPSLLTSRTSWLPFSATLAPPPLHPDLILVLAPTHPDLVKLLRLTCRPPHPPSHPRHLTVQNTRPTLPPLEQCSCPPTSQPTSPPTPSVHPTVWGRRS